MKKLILVGTLMGASFGTFAATDTTKEWQVDYKGKPPYKRTLVEVDVVDIAQMETAETALVRSTDFSGKPPFKRNAERLEVIDAAQMEATDTDGKKVRRGRPPFKRN